MKKVEVLTNLFNCKIIKTLKGVENGERISIIYIKLAFLYIEEGGSMKINGTGYTYDSKILSALLDEKVEDILIALPVLEKYKLIKYGDNINEFANVIVDVNLKQLNLIELEDY